MFTIHCLNVITAANESLKDNEVTRAGAPEVIPGLCEIKISQQLLGEFLQFGICKGQNLFLNHP